MKAKRTSIQLTIMGKSSPQMSSFPHQRDGSPPVLKIHTLLDTLESKDGIILMNMNVMETAFKTFPVYKIKIAQKHFYH